jgi:uncharacterized protein (DUF697 family)/GTP-binding protein EngB required for normal cell division
MANNDRRRRAAKAARGTRDWAGRAGEDVVDRLGHAWDSVKDRRARKPELEGPKTPDKDLDDAALFDRDRRREAEKLGHANILVIGQTGVGKSTLINAIFRKPLATTGIGKPVTQIIQRFEDPDVPVTLYDTKGVELGDSRRSVIRDYKRLIAQQRKGPPEQHIHLLWYCMDAGQTRVEDYDVEIMAALADEVPVILVFTQVIDEERADGLEAAVRDANLELAGNHAVRTLAQPRTIGTQTLESRGLEELVRMTDQLLPEAVKRAFVNAQGVVIELKVDQSRAVVVAASAAAAGAAAAPVPMSDAVLLRPIQLGMLASITAIFGLELSGDQNRSLLKAAVGHGSMELAGKRLVKELSSRLPGANVINAAVAGALTGALGEAYVRMCAELLRRQAAGRPMPAPEMLDFLSDMYGRLLRRKVSGELPAGEGPG